MECVITVPGETCEGAMSHVDGPQSVGRNTGSVFVFCSYNLGGRERILDCAQTIVYIEYLVLDVVSFVSHHSFKKVKVGSLIRYDFSIVRPFKECCALCRSLSTISLLNLYLTVIELIRKDPGVNFML